jgi:hypothetical protein
MHIDHDGMALVTESDVEQKLIMPLLTGAAYLDISESKIKTKQYLAPTEINKKAGQTSGHYPDYSIWFRSFPCLIVEAKSPEVSAETGYREAQLYAQFLNQHYPSGLNPAHFVLATNGLQILCGFWDAKPVVEGLVSDLRPQSALMVELQKVCGTSALDHHAIKCLNASRTDRVLLPYNLVGGPALLRTTVPPNQFAAPLAPLLIRFFSPSQQENIREIVERAYVSSDEVTEYDKILESLLKERISAQRGSIVEQLAPARRGEDTLERTIAEFSKDRPASGHLQLIQGAVGSGKSLFIERYKQMLQPQEAKAKTKWATVDFNSAPVNLTDASDWLCRTFISSFERENPDVDLSSLSVLRGIYSRNIQRKKAIYSEFDKASPERGVIARAEDLAKWQDDHEETARGIAEYILRGRHGLNESLVVVMDNVDRLDLANQLAAFQLTLWFMQLTRAFTILQMRDETYERFKDKPPLDTYRTGVIFHISPPRFVDVVKRRLELSIEYLSSGPKDDRTYAIESGLRIRYSQNELENFLRRLYDTLFDRRGNIARVLEALAGKDVRRALEMFVSIITSGHLSTTAIASHTLGSGEVPLEEHTILKILMRTNRRLFSKDSGFIQNIFSFDETCQKPDNFLLVEILFFLFQNRKSIGAIGLEGYFSCRQLTDALQKLGYIPDDVMIGLRQLVRSELVITDRMSSVDIADDDSVRILAAGWVHLRLLSSRLEYLYGVIATTPIKNPQIAVQLAELTKLEVERGDIQSLLKIRAVDTFHAYLWREHETAITPFNKGSHSGADYVLEHMRIATLQARNPSKIRESSEDILDL